LIIPMALALILLFGCSAQVPQQSAKPETTKAIQPVFQVSELTISPDMILTGDMIAIKATISEANKQSGTYEATLTMDKKIVGQQTIIVPQGSSKEALFTLSVKDPGQYEVALGDKTAKFVAYRFDSQNPVTIQYDHLGEGIQNYLYVGSYIPGNLGYMVWFTAPAYPFKITAVSMSAGAVGKGSGSLSNRFFTVNIYDNASADLLWTRNYYWDIYRASNLASMIWADIKIPDIVVNKDFDVEIVTHSDPYVKRPGMPSNAIPVGDIYSMVLDYEDTKEPTRSSISYQGKPVDTSLNVNWYIRIIGQVPAK